MLGRTQLYNGQALTSELIICALERQLPTSYPTCQLGLDLSPCIPASIILVVRDQCSTLLNDHEYQIAGILGLMPHAQTVKCHASDEDKTPSAAIVIATSAITETPLAPEEVRRCDSSGLFVMS